MHNHSYENEFNLHVNEISFSYEKMSTKTRFEEEAKGNSEMAYCKWVAWIHHSIPPRLIRGPVELSLNRMVIERDHPFKQSTVYPSSIDILQWEHVDGIFYIQKPSLFHRIKCVVKYMANTSKNIPPKPFDSLVPC